MLLKLFFVSIFSVGLMIPGAGVVFGQDYPNKPIRIVTSSVGGDNDFAARLVGQGLTANLGQQVIVHNNPAGVIQGQVASRATPDGYTLLYAGTALWVETLLNNTPYDPVMDFSPITLAISSSNVLVVHSSLPVKSVKELIALAKAKPGELNYGSGVGGSSGRLAAELFKAMAGVNILSINYKGAAATLNGLFGGEVQLAFGGTKAVIPHIKSGRLMALAVTSAQPSALLPGLPTVAASLPGYELVGVDGVFAPAKTPAMIINRLNQEIVRVLNRADVKEKFFNVGAEVVGSSPGEFAATIKSDMTKLGKVIKDAGIRVE